jgi:YD repeat-containing protein
MGGSTAVAASIFSGTATATYRLDGLLGTRTTPNGEAMTLAYDTAKRPVTATLANASTISQTYDRTGNVTAEARALAGVAGDPGANTNSFSYDPLRRLTSETGLSASRSYQYDLDGNRTRKVEGATTIDYTYDRTDQLNKQRISGLDTVASYDAYGDLTQSGTSISAVTTYGYDTASHLKSINGPGVSGEVRRRARRRPGEGTYVRHGSTCVAIGVWCGRYGCFWRDLAAVAHCRPRSSGAPARRYLSVTLADPRGPSASSTSESRGPAPWIEPSRRFSPSGAPQKPSA